MVKPSGARHGTVFAVTGFILDKNEPTGFRWEKTDVINKNKVISTKESLFNSSKERISLKGKKIRIYTLQGKQLVNANVEDFSKLSINSLPNCVLILSINNEKEKIVYNFLRNSK